MARGLVYGEKGEELGFDLKKDLNLNKEDSLIISGLIVFAGGVFLGYYY
jgi:hypothetical protein